MSPFNVHKRDTDAMMRLGLDKSLLDILLSIFIIRPNEIVFGNLFNLKYFELRS